MSDFLKFRDAVSKQLSLMTTSQTELFEVDIDKDTIWQTYLSSFPEGTNPMYLERTEHDCQCCKQFIRDVGKIVGIKGSMSSVWDIAIDDDTYQPVADAMAALVKSAPIKGVYRHYQKGVGTEKNNAISDDGKVTTWEHFFHTLDAKLVMPKHSIPTFLGKRRADRDVLERSLTEISMEAIEIVSELIDQNSLYRGEEHKTTVQKLLKTKKAFDKLSKPENKEEFLWLKSAELGPAGRFKNTVIGTLLVDITTGVDLTRAVKAFEDKVAPANYKRPTALITQGMIKKAQEKVEELGLTSALQRRFAITEDLTVNNVLFADRSSKKVMQGGVFDELSPTKTNKPNLNSVTEVSIEDFVANILPKADSLELMMENRHVNNLVSLIAPEDQEAGNILKWDNNFSWSYNGEVTDSMKERVKSAGGDVTGVLRFSIQWNEEKQDQNIDFDAHCKEPDDNLIYYGSKTSRKTRGTLDVDIMDPGTNIAVENITWNSTRNMSKGDYQFIVHNYSSRTSVNGFKAEVEFNGQTHSFVYDRPLRENQKIKVADVTFNGTNFVIKKHLSSEEESKEIWGLNTQQFHKVDMAMFSPNFWDEQEKGNKHWFFMLEKCINPDPARGFYNEFLRGELEEHKKVFETLGSKLKTAETDKQLSGLGFSSTQKNSVVCKVSGTFNRTVKINF